MSWSSGKATVVLPSEWSDDVEMIRPGPEIELNSEDLARRRIVLFSCCDIYDINAEHIIIKYDLRNIQVQISNQY